MELQQLHPVIIVIVLMSFMGLVINLTDDNIEAKQMEIIKKPSLKSESIIDKYIIKDPTREEYIKDKINLIETLGKGQSAPVRFDAMGNLLGLNGNGLGGGKQIVNAKAKGGGVPTVKLGENAGATALKVNNTNYGDDGNVALKNPGLPFNAYANFESGSLEPISAEEIRNNVGPMRESKMNGFTGQIYNPGGNLMVPYSAYEPLVLTKEILNLGNRLRSNKNDDIYLQNVDRSRVQERNAFNISRVESDVYEIHDKPNPNDIANSRNVERAKDLDEVLHRQNYMDLLRKTGTTDKAIQLKHKM